MKKFTKIGILVLALIALTTSLFTKAGTVTKKVSLTLLTGNNTCTIVDYAFGTKNASVTAFLLGEKTGNIVCEFLENTGATVSLSLTKLTGTNSTIEYSNFQFKINSATSIGQISNLSAKNYTTFGQSSTAIYTKDRNKLGKWTSLLTLSGTVPAGTPGGTYTGELNLMIQ